MPQRPMSLIDEGDLPLLTAEDKQPAPAANSAPEGAPSQSVLPPAQTTCNGCRVKPPQCLNIESIYNQQVQTNGLDPCRLDEGNLYIELTLYF